MITDGISDWLYVGGMACFTLMWACVVAGLIHFGWGAVLSWDSAPWVMMCFAVILAWRRYRGASIGRSG